MKTTDSRYTVIKLPGKGEGWALYDVTIKDTIVGTRSKTRKEVKEAAAELGIQVR